MIDLYAVPLHPGQVFHFVLTMEGMTMRLNGALRVSMPLGMLKNMLEMGRSFEWKVIGMPGAKAE